MVRAGLILLCIVSLACNNGKKNDNESEFDYDEFSGSFKVVNTYSISDTALLRNKDTTTIRSQVFSQFLSDSLKTRIFGKASKPKYVALAQVKAEGNTQFYFVRGSNGNKRSVLLYVFDDGAFSTVFPFLIPDTDPGTSQISSVDRSFSIIKAISQKQPAAEGKDVYEYDASIKNFTLILTDPLNKKNR